jgi:small subunit ribosomal protein S20
LTFYSEKRIVRRPKTQSSDLRGQILANIASARKRARTAEKSRQRNVAMRSKLRTFIKNVVKAIDAGNKDEAQQLYVASVPIIDSSARKGIIHTNKAARHKQRLNSRIRTM